MCVCVCVCMHVDMHVRVCVYCMISIHLQLFSCWINSDDGAIAAFIAPIVAIILVAIVSSNHTNDYIIMISIG